MAMKEMAMSVFIQKYNQFTTSFNDVTVNGDVIINQSNRADYQFQNCTFHKLSFENVGVGSLKFIECIVEQLTLTDVEINDLTFVHSNVQRIELIKCQRGNLIINTGSKINSIEINDGALTSLSLKNSTFKELTINNCSSTKKIELVNSPSPVVERMEDRPILTITNVKDARLTLDYCGIKEAKINNSNLEAFQIQNCEIIDIPIEKTNIVSVGISNSKIKNLKSNGSTITNFVTNKSDFEKIEIHASQIFQYGINGSIDQTKSKVSVLDFCESSISSKGALKISDLQIDNLIINHLKALGPVEISNSKINNIFSFEYSQLGESSFNSLNLRDCQEIKTLNSSFTSCKFFNVQWPSNYRIYEYQKEIDHSTNAETKITKYYNPLRESYRQLVSVSNRELNKIDSLFFQKQELRIYFKIIKFHKWKSWGNFQDFLVLGSNKLFSDFGQNIWKPLVWWLPIHGLLFSLIIMNFDLGIEFVNR
ncbi:MAG: hypothetical protein KF856_06675 [Cyclobacteriaceae bacterium]|nr:hypothetical protein [Cyclobacteriaceae bacterium]